MRKLRAPMLGPIVGHTTATSARLWIRGRDPKGRKRAARRTVGVLVVVEAGGKRLPADKRHAAYFRLHRHYDRTGTYTLGEDVTMGLAGAAPFTLDPDTDYVVRMATLAVDDPYLDDETVEDGDVVADLPDPASWHADLMELDPTKSEARFSTFPKEDHEGLTFLLGSCRYPGVLLQKKKSDRIFGPMLDQTTAGGGDARFSLMVGDQIYADMFNRHIPLGVADTREEFLERYEEAFGSKNMRALLRQAPSYMILDDHEIEDNWSQDRLHEKRSLFNVAIRAYMGHQWSHGPRTFGQRLFYNFECAGFPFFVLDERTRRVKQTRDEKPGQSAEDRIRDNHLLGRPARGPVHDPSQLDHLKKWLTAQQEMRGDRPKLIVSPSVFVPNNLKTAGDVEAQDASDSWPAFPTTRRDLLSHIVNGEIQNVVFLSGDIHCSNVAEMTFKKSGVDHRIRAFSVTSSALYWPWPFADGDPVDYVHNSTADGDTFTIDPETDLTMDYTASAFTQEDNFCRLVVDWSDHSLTIQAVDKDGAGIRTRDSAGRKSADTVLSLAKPEGG